MCVFDVVGFYGILTFVGYLIPNPFYTNNQLNFKQFSLALVDSLSKTFLLLGIQFCQTVLIQRIQFSISISFIYTRLNFKTVQFQTIQFCVSKVLYKTVLFKAIHFSISTQFSSI